VQAVGKHGVIRVKRQERYHFPEEVFGVLRLGLLPAAGVGLLPLCVPFRGSFCFEISTDAVDGSRRCPNPFGEDLPALLLLYNPVISRRLNSASQCSVTGR
jgi:hypothetical protein